MEQFFVDTHFVSGTPSAREVAAIMESERAYVVNPKYFVGDIRSANKRIRKLRVDNGVYAVRYYAPHDRLEGLSRVLWNNRDCQYLSDIMEIRKAIMQMVGSDDENALFPDMGAGLRRELDIPEDVSVPSYDCTFYGGGLEVNEALQNLADALESQIREWRKSRVAGVFEARTAILRVRKNFPQN